MLILSSICQAVPVWEKLEMRRKDAVSCGPNVIRQMAQFGVDTSKLQCFSQTRVRRGCCAAECVWMAKELGVEPSSLICPT